MTRQPCVSGRGVTAAFVSVAAASALLFLLALAAAHVHDDFKGHKDCAVCLCQTFFFSLTHKGITLTSIAAVAFLVCVCLRLPLSAQVIGQAPIRAPPDFQD